MLHLSVYRYGNRVSSRMVLFDTVPNAKVQNVFQINDFRIIYII